MDAISTKKLIFVEKTDSRSKHDVEIHSAPEVVAPFSAFCVGAVWAEARVLQLVQQASFQARQNAVAGVCSGPSL